jgi:hypothetical protein
MRSEFYTKTFIVHDDYHILKTYDNERGAKIALARRWKKKYPNAVIMDSNTFQQTEPIVESTNLMSGKKIMIPKSQAGGCTDPGTELYWSS